MVVAAEWTSRVTTISLEMVLPGLVGFWIGRLLGSMIWAIVLLMLGVILGVTVALIHLVRLASTTSSGEPMYRRSSETGPAVEKPSRVKASESEPPESGSGSSSSR